MQEPLLKYRLPAVACPPPLVLQITPVLSIRSSSRPKAVLFVVQYHVNPQLRGHLRSATFTLQCPRILGEPKKVHQSQYSVHIYLALAYGCVCLTSILCAFMCYLSVGSWVLTYAVSICRVTVSHTQLSCLHNIRL